MRRKSHHLHTFRVFLLLSLNLTNGRASELPFQYGEKLEFSLKWGFFPVGYAIMEVMPQGKYKGKDCLNLSFSVRTNKFADAFYKVRTSVESIVSQNFDRSLAYRKNQIEGGTIKQVEVVFDYSKGIAKYMENGEDERILEIPNPVFDPLAIAYLHRLNPMSQGLETVLPTCDGKRYREIVVRNGKSKNLSVPAGKFRVVPAVPEMKNLSGVFKKSPDGILQIWYSMDKRKIPVKISSKVVVGSFTAKLVKASGLKPLR